MVHKDRQLAKSNTAWTRSFACNDLKPLIICRGPIRKEAMDVFDEMGINHYGILLSEKDSITYTNALAPELRTLTDPDRVHRVPDYTGATKEERIRRIQQIISIAYDNGYNGDFCRLWVYVGRRRDGGIHGKGGAELYWFVLFHPKISRYERPGKAHCLGNWRICYPRCKQRN